MQERGREPRRPGPKRKGSSRAATVFVALMVALLPGIALAASVTIAPASYSLPLGGARAFTGAATGLSTGAVTWEVNGKPGGTSSDGTVSATGVYTAPDDIATAPKMVTVTARALADPTVAASALVTVRHRIPWITQVSPNAFSAGVPFTLDIVGSRFAVGVQAFLGAAALDTTRLSDTHLLATGSVPAKLIGALNFRVANPGGVDSGTVALVAVPASSAGPPDPATIAAVRFLEQATFGPTDDDIVDVRQNGIDAWMTAQMDPAVTPPSTIADGLSTNQASAELVRQMATAPDQLRQRMAFALSQIFVISMQKNVNGDELTPFVRILSNNAFGNFRTLLQEVTLSPCMGKYLDMVRSVKPSLNNKSGANENYARELMQLFTIGTYKLDRNGFAILDENGHTIPTYDQEVVRNLALALTGWVYPAAPGATAGANTPPYFNGWMAPWEAFHDRTRKTLFDGIVIPAGMMAADELDLVLDHVFQHPNVPPFFATRLIRSLVTSNPSPEYIERVAAVFADNGRHVRGDLAAVLKAVLTDAEARRDAPTPAQGRLKDPLLHFLGLVRALDGQVIDATQVLHLFSGIGEKALSSPTVFSFYSPLGGLPGRPDLYGPEFQIFTPALAIQRANMVYSLLTGQLSGALSVDITRFVNAASIPVNLVNLIDLELFRGGMSPLLRQALLSDSFVVTDPRQRAIGALFLAAVSSEYTVLR